EDRPDVEIHQIGSDFGGASRSAAFDAYGERVAASRDLGCHLNVNAPVRLSARGQVDTAALFTIDRDLPRLRRQLEPEIFGGVEIAVHLKGRVGQAGQSDRAEIERFGEALKSQLLGLSAKLVFVGLQIDNAAGCETALRQTRLDAFEANHLPVEFDYGQRRLGALSRDNAVNQIEIRLALWRARQSGQMRFAGDLSGHQILLSGN